MRWVESHTGGRSFWWEADKAPNLWIDLTDEGFVLMGVAEVSRITVKPGQMYPESRLDQLAGPFDNLDAAKAAYILIGENS